MGGASAAITASDPGDEAELFEPATAKPYRHPTFYTVPKEVGATCTSMAEYLLLMHDDAVADDAKWEPYLRGLRQRGCFDGGSEIGDGVCVRKDGSRTP